MTAPLQVEHPGRIVESATLQYGPLVVRYESPEGTTRFRVPPEFEEFLAPDESAPGCRVSWTMGPVGRPAEPPLLEGQVWDYWRLPDESDLAVFYWRDDRSPYLELRFSPDLARATIVQDGAQIGDETANVGMHPMTELIACRLLPGLGALNLHASGAVLDGRAVLFMGHSGAGKTTIADIASRAGAPILSDDRTIIGFRDGEPYAWGTPWHGTGRHTSSRTAPLGGIFLLVQAPDERVVRIPGPRAFQEMFVRLIHQKLTPRETEDALAALERLVGAVPVYELHFRPVPAALDAIRSALGGTPGA